MTHEADRWLAQVLASEWIADGFSVPCRPILAGADEVHFGSVAIPLQNLIDAEPAPGAPYFTVVRAGWKIVSIKQYRPLIYYAAFGNPDIFACLRLAVESALTYGRWRHEILVLTSTAQIAAVEAALASLALGSRLHVAAVPGADVLDWCCARYRLCASPIFQAAQPLLYLDTDIICDQPIDTLMAGMVWSDRIHVRSEGTLNEGEPETDGHWFGWRLMAADNVPFDPHAAGFSSGAIGFANAAIARDSFAAILASAYGHAGSIGNRHRFAGYDQPFANYVLRKQGRFATDLLDPVLRMHRAEGDQIDLPSVAAATGLVHFTAGVGLAGRKRGVMERYLHRLGSGDA